ncbi:ATP-binding protein [Ruminococcus sp.]|uniref:ATP-binding protein n=1 Tax=Ruminococcus sp. TaxID=41978 RepID=UPI0025E45A67|nr:ATP-binding protein [Ruminococcus sp.]MBQ8965346.1 ATP-binding protein [Ruminococcus sp.]
MKYSERAFELAENELRERRERAEEEHRLRLEEISLEMPEVYRLNNEALRLNYSLIGNIGGNSGKESVSERIAAIRDKNLSIRHTMRALLKENGYDEDYLQYHYVCEKCRDTGYHEGVRCECMKKLLEKYTTNELNSFCSIKLHDFSEFDINFYSPAPLPDGESPRSKMTKVFQFCKSYTYQFNEYSPSMIFYGRTGLGKTFLSSCMAKELIAQGRNVVYGSATNLLHRIEEERFRKAEGDTTAILLGAELLILDDLGAEFKTTFTESVIYEIINERLNNRKPTIISSNLSSNELYQKYNERIVSRIVGNFIPHIFVGNDIRQIKPSYK